MPSIMRRMNVISRCATAYKTENGDIESISGCHHAFFFPICAHPGLSQDALVKHTRLNKSTVTRSLAYLEEHGFIKREQDPSDKRSLLVFPTDKMLSVFPDIRRLAKAWNSALTEGIAEEELSIFESVLEKLQSRAEALAFGEENEV